MAQKVLITTLFKPEPALVAATKIGPDRMIILMDDEPNKDQNESFKLIENSIGKVIDIKTIKTSVYDIVQIATEVVKTIDAQPKSDEIFVNITSGRKTKAIGLLFACYTRHESVKRILYFPEENANDVVYLPRLSFHLTESQKTILEHLHKGKFQSITDLAEKIDLSKGMLYRAIDELKDMDLLTTDDGLKLTDAGKIARL